jgi:hypothetical protein
MAYTHPISNNSTSVTSSRTQSVSREESATRIQQLLAYGFTLTEYFSVEVMKAVHLCFIDLLDEKEGAGARFALTVEVSHSHTQHNTTQHNLLLEGVIVSFSLTFLSLSLSVWCVGGLECVQEGVRNPAGNLHGGATATLLDMLTTWTLMAFDGE